MDIPWKMSNLPMLCCSYRIQWQCFHCQLYHCEQYCACRCGKKMRGKEEKICMNHRQISFTVFDFNKRLLEKGRKVRNVISLWLNCSCQYNFITWTSFCIRTLTIVLLEVCLPLPLEHLAHQLRDCGLLCLALWKATWCFCVCYCCCVSWEMPLSPPVILITRDLPGQTFLIKIHPFLPHSLQTFLSSDLQIYVLSHTDNMFSYFGSYSFTAVICCLLLASAFHLGELLFSTMYLSGIQKSLHVRQDHL